MFCPKCKNLAFPDEDKNIKCTNYKCQYEGPVNETVFIPSQGEVNVLEAVTGWGGNLNRTCRTPGCYTRVNDSQDYCGSCPGNSGMVPGKFYRQWPW